MFDSTKEDLKDLLRHADEGRLQAPYARQPVRTRTPQGKEVERYYYLDIKTAVNGGAVMEDSIIAVPADRIIRRDFGREIVLDLSTPETEVARDDEAAQATGGTTWARRR